MKRRTFLRNSGTLGLTALITPVGIFRFKSITKEENLSDKDFLNPPSYARPHTWWHWMNGNVTREGITLDLEAMARVGLGGFQNFDAGTGIPKGPIEYLSPEWIELKHHAIAEAARLGLEFTMHNCPGWSSSGGPWITPEMSMKEVTWSELVISGGRSINVLLPQPFKRLDFYREIAVLACRSLPGEWPLQDVVARARTSALTQVPVESIAGQNKQWLKISGTSEKEDFIDIEFYEPHEFRQISFISSVHGQASGPIVIKGSSDGKNFIELIKINNGTRWGEPQGPVVSSETFSPTLIKILRLSVNHEREFTQIRLSNVVRSHEWQKRANFSFNRYGVSETTEKNSVKLSDIIDITQFVDSAGHLTWNAPPGYWTILRFGYTSNGSGNRSAPDTGVGLECDKYDAKAIEFHFNKMMEELLPSLKAIASKGKTGLLIDSYEVGMQNWTHGFEQIFLKKTGHAIQKYLPALTGRVVENADTTDRFLWDFRRAQGDLMADNYYGKFTELCHQHNLISYCQPYDRGPMEEMQIGSRVDINVGEFWNQLSSIFQNNRTMRRTVKLCASIAHTNGQNVVAAESYTGEPESSKWQEYPFGLKSLGDKMFTQGLSRMVFHRFAHQPHPTAVPGMTMGPWGTHFDRTNTWWEQGSAWIQYLTRCQYLLQEGRSFADLAYFTGEDAGIYTRVEPDELVPPPPEGYDYDLINGETILKNALVKDGKLVLKNGVQYSVLVLQDFDSMSINLLRKIRDFIHQGLLVIGKRPSGTPGLQADDAAFKSLSNELWAETSNHKILWNVSLDEVLKSKNLSEDFSFTSASGNAPVTWIHRKADDLDIYFIANQRRVAEELVCRFRIDNRQPELWSPIDGTISRIPIFESVGGNTAVPIKLDPTGSAFIVFREGIRAPVYQSLIHAGETIVETKPFHKTRILYADVYNDFTIALWVKSENHVMLATDNFMDGQEPWTDFYTIYPSPGEKLYGKGHSTCGLTVGRNGVAVWENNTGKPVFVFAVEKPLSGWNHIALAYQKGVPVIMINGEQVKVGEKSLFTVHPSVGEAYLREGASFYNGDMTTPELHARYLDASEIKTLSLKQPDTTFRESLRYHDGGLIFFNSGKYLLKGKERQVEFEIPRLQTLDLSREWAVNFPVGSGAPSKIKLDELLPLNHHHDPGVRYFSGTCNYSRSFSFRKPIGKSLKHFLDLGVVEVLCEVIINGKSCGIFWARPFLVDITDFLTEGENDIEIKVTNLWPNRLIGDEQVAEPYQYAPGGGGSGFASLSGGAILQLPDWYKRNLPKPDDGKVTFATWKHYHQDSPLLQSGLIGPVVLRTAFLYEV